jgi:hypothetical protein
MHFSYIKGEELDQLKRLYDKWILDRPKCEVIDLRFQPIRETSLGIQLYDLIIIYKHKK